jgi:predicted DCC family thiol-disulfide oxidoreductase YuxK
MEGLPKDKKIILFDGICNFCEASVLFVIRHDKKDVFRFVAIESDLGKKIIQYIGMDSKHIDSIILYSPGISYYYKSQAALEIAKNLGGLFHFGTLFRIIPNGLRNVLYDYIAKNRYVWFGKKDSCMVATTEIQSKFL